MILIQYILLSDLSNKFISLVRLLWHVIDFPILQIETIFFIVTREARVQLGKPGYN